MPEQRGEGIAEVESNEAEKEQERRMIERCAEISRNLSEILSSEVPSRAKLERSYQERERILREGTLGGIFVYSEKIEPLLDPRGDLQRDKKGNPLQPVSRSEMFSADIFEGKNQITSAVKPAKGEAPMRWGIPKGSYYLREWTAEIISRALELDVVPATVIRNTHRGIASAQEWAYDTVEAFEVEDWKKEINQSALEKLGVFDRIVWSTDRHLSNFLIHKGSGEGHAIDNALILTSDQTNDPLISRPLEATSEQEISRDVIEKLNRFFRSQARQEIVREALSFTVDPTELKPIYRSMLNRIKVLTEDRKFPHYEFPSKYAELIGEAK